ncbi:hypothetical protein Ocepr_1119 [Oceanithermus profundus DSM 14977]|uniref:Uncharacterized protein n=1 Tax=Oceanithermus profundus (strain DSM 14977 / NBRC 100410 / VKM B-2274 / 506) TaxID=670487 RepID=E4U7X7_OCEP5|nr:hypothetical protein [Oceanithermus profundus]ADR36576.1 hypothetical protein Ocepr_1119 [Oceanithermus profundus DSM 14977]
MGSGNLNPHAINEAIEQRLLLLRTEAARLRTTNRAMPRSWRRAAARLLMRAARWFMHAAERLEVGRLEEQASGA